MGAVLKSLSLSSLAARLTVTGLSLMASEFRSQSHCSPILSLPLGFDSRCPSHVVPTTFVTTLCLSLSCFYKTCCQHLLHC